MDMETKSVLEMAHGAIAERADYEMARIIENILDANTPAIKKRVLTLTLELTPDAERRNIQMNCVAKSALVPTNPVATALYVTNGEDGDIAVVELMPHAPMSAEVPESVKLRLVGGDM